MVKLQGLSTRYQWQWPRRQQMRRSASQHRTPAALPLKASLIVVGIIASSAAVACNILFGVHLQTQVRRLRESRHITPMKKIAVLEDSKRGYLKSEAGSDPRQTDVDVAQREKEGEQTKGQIPEDVDAYFKARFPGSGAIAHCESRHSSSIPGCVYILGATRSLVFAGTSKMSKMAEFDLMLGSVLSRMAPRMDGRNISFGMDLRASGGRERTEAKAPILKITQKSDSGGDAGVLVPNPYFIVPTWWESYARNVAEKARKRPWNMRESVVFFRGACGPGAHERVRLMMMRQSEPRLDVGFSKVLGERYARNLTSCVYDVGERMGLSQGRLSELVKQEKKVPKVHQDDFSKYQYLLHMPGSAAGSYSRGLQSLFMHGSIVLIWQSNTAYVEFYYPKLVPRVHFLPVDSRNLTDTLNEVQSDPDLQRTLVEGSLHALESIVAANPIFERWEAVLDPIIARQNGTIDLPSTACSCDNATKFPPCAHCKRVDVLRKMADPTSNPIFDYTILN